VTDVRRSGLVALAGRPNVGKSTLVNRMVGEHVVAVSERPQTPGRRVLGPHGTPMPRSSWSTCPGSSGRSTG